MCGSSEERVERQQWPHGPRGCGQGVDHIYRDTDTEDGAAEGEQRVGGDQEQVGPVLPNPGMIAETVGRGRTGRATRRQGEQHGRHSEAGGIEPDGELVGQRTGEEQQPAGAERAQSVATVLDHPRQGEPGVGVGRASFVGHIGDDAEDRRPEGSLAGCGEEGARKPAIPAACAH